MIGHHDVLVAGVGSGGFGAALAAARLGMRVLAVESGDQLGGTSVRAGVSIWEPGCGGTGIPFDLYQRLKTIPGAVGIYSMARHLGWPEDGFFPGGESVIDPTRSYADSLVRMADGVLNRKLHKYRIREVWHGVPFDPAVMARTMEDMLLETGRVTLLKNTRTTAAEVADGRIHSVRLNTGETVSSTFYIDATGDGKLSEACGCEMMSGQEPRRRFDEPAAPEEATDSVNGATLVFRVARTQSPGLEPLPDDIPADCWWRDSFPSVSVVELPNGELNMNMLPTMEGKEYLRLRPEAAYAECQRRIRAAWHWCQTVLPEFQHYRISWIAPELGVRESRRVLGRYVLTQHDLAAGLAGQNHPDIIAIADHPMDTHGSQSKGCGGVTSAYGIPYRCLIPKDMRNLLVACRSASFSSLAASSCRLSRTMIQLGQAAGTATAIARELALDLPDIPPDRLRAELRRQHVALEHPTGERMKDEG
jgi:hypothetical protein